MEDKFEFKGKPVAKPRMVKADVWKKRKIVLDYWAFKDDIKAQAKKQKFELCGMYKVTFLVEIPKSRKTGKNKVVSGQPHLQRPDLDNYVKALNDCLLEEDDHVWYFVAQKRWSDKPGIKVENFPDNLDF